MVCGSVGVGALFLTLYVNEGAVAGLMHACVMCVCVCVCVAWAYCLVCAVVYHLLITTACDLGLPHIH